MAGHAKLWLAGGMEASWSILPEARHSPDSLRRVMSAGAPVPASVLVPMKAAIHPDGELHVPYGATEALPVATIEASEVLSQTWPLTEHGRGVCVGRRFPGITWRVIRIVDGPLRSIDDAEDCRWAKLAN